MKNEVEQPQNNYKPLLSCMALIVGTFLLLTIALAVFAPMLNRAGRDAVYQRELEKVQR